MDSAVIEDVANTFAKLRMYPYFDICHYILMSIAVKEDTPQSGLFWWSDAHLQDHHNFPGGILFLAGWRRCLCALVELFSPTLYVDLPYLFVSMIPVQW